MDLGLLGRALPPDTDLIASIMREVAGTELENGVRFDPASIRAARIREEAIYEGVRAKLTG